MRKKQSHEQTWDTSVSMESVLPEASYREIGMLFLDRKCLSNHNPPQQHLVKLWRKFPCELNETIIWMCFRMYRSSHLQNWYISCPSPGSQGGPGYHLLEIENLVFLHPPSPPSQLIPCCSLSHLHPLPFSFFCFCSQSEGWWMFTEKYLCTLVFPISYC